MNLISGTRLLLKSVLLLLLLLPACLVFSASVDTITIYSKAMQKDLKAVVILPESYKNKSNRYPVVYLLHGASGNFSNWITKVPGIKAYADQFQLIIVCPDGGRSSWYFDSKIDENSQYETHIAKEVPAYIDAEYHTMPGKQHRAITGLSMGGHGALSLAWKYSQFFGAAGSMSGALDLVPFKGRYSLSQVLGDTASIAVYQQASVVNLTLNSPPEIPKLIIDCGLEDPFIPSNRQLHLQLSNAGIPHDYIERDGKHDWKYWDNAVGYQLMFFDRFFSKK